MAAGFTSVRIAGPKRFGHVHSSPLRPLTPTPHPPPAKALKFSQNATPASSGQSRSLEILERLAQASADDLPALYAELASSSDLSDLTARWERWVDLDPAGGYAFVSRLAADNEENRARVWWYLRAWSAIDPDAAIKEAKALGTEKDRHVALSRIWGELSSRNPAPSIQIRTLPPNWHAR